ncbi:hypothetical protein F5883DRAFT_410739, partial [Diaporthe sp. PMI_573]
WLYNVENRLWLLVLENVDNDNKLFNADYNYIYTKNTIVNIGRERAFWRYLPQSLYSLILIITRNKKVARRLTGNYKNIVEVLLIDKNYILTLLAKVKSQPNKDYGAALVEAFKYISLVISQARVYI